MTNREFLNAVATNDTLPEDVRAYANASIEKLDAALAARKNKPSKKAVENAPIIEQIVRICYEGGDPKESISALMTRESKHEREVFWMD